MNKKQGIIGGTAAACAAALIMTMSGGQVAEIDYEIIPQNEYVYTMTIDVPDELNVDIVELLLNDTEVDKVCLPENSFASVPLVFENLENLELKLYRRGRCVGTAEFEGMTLTAEVKGGASSD